MLLKSSADCTILWSWNTPQSDGIQTTVTHKMKHQKYFHPQVYASWRVDFGSLAIIMLPSIVDQKNGNDYLQK